MRLDIEELSVDTIYITVWASPYLPLHMGKTEKACTMVEDHFGHQLQVQSAHAMDDETAIFYSRAFILLVPLSFILWVMFTKFPDLDNTSMRR